ncbi:hypothetical protein DN069_20320 [Streptacidiphilus pinicola]|uniref:Uncharacterized protein n=1 Tax=Streptacidiphilus pinicola TaxID=2219663 RepID=A0A2X0IGV9_9ACTN|nr:hypothetical protein [Streptacidiphilus pinicola]RAG83787.1 hypothetical protein DN069_20320 [Streptacidiphilus pinicola]
MDNDAIVKLPAWSGLASPGQRPAVRGLLQRDPDFLVAASEVLGGSARTRAHISVTSGQWRSVLGEADLSTTWGSLHGALAHLLEVLQEDGSQGSNAERRLARAVDELRAGVRSMVADVDILRFLPPETAYPPRRDLARYVSLVGRVVAAIAVCEKQDWSEPGWRQLISLTGQASAEVRQLTIDEAPVLVKVEDGAIQRAIGIDDRELVDGQGLAFTSRLEAVWSRDETHLDRRLRGQSAHLIDSSVALSPSLRRHLIVLITSSFPLVANRVAVAARDLVLEALGTDEAAFMAAWEEQWAGERTMWQGHAGFFKAHRELESSDRDDEHKLESAANAYVLAVEGDARRTAIAALAFAGQRLPGDSTLRPVHDALARRKGRLFEALASVIDVPWRNAIAHRDIWWDSALGAARLGEDTVTLESLFMAAERARAVCQAFHHGMEVAFAIAKPPVRDWLTKAPESARNLAILEAMGGYGISVHDLRRSGSTLELVVQSLDSDSFLRLCLGIVRSAELDPAISHWLVWQRTPNLTPISLDRNWVERLLAEATGGTLRAPEDIFPLTVNALINSGSLPAPAVRHVIALAAAQVTGEAARLGSELAAGDEDAQASLHECVVHCRRGLGLAAELSGDESAGKLVSRIDGMLASVEAWSAGSIESLNAALAPVQAVLRARRAMAPPWFQV